MPEMDSVAILAEESSTWKQFPWWATWCSRAETETPVSTLLALNQSGEKLALSQCVNFYQINSLGYDSIEPIYFFLSPGSTNQTFSFAEASF